MPSRPRQRLAVACWQVSYPAPPSIRRLLVSSFSDRRFRASWSALFFIGRFLTSVLKIAFFLPACHANSLEVNNLRMGRDSNPRYLSVHTLSRRAQSTALAPILQKVGLWIRMGEGANEIAERRTPTPPITLSFGFDLPTTKAGRVQHPFRL